MTNIKIPTIFLKSIDIKRSAKNAYKLNSEINVENFQN